MSSRGKRRKTGKAGGRKRKAGGSINLTVVTCEGHAAKLLASIHILRSSHPELLDLPTRLVLRTGGSSGAEITTAQTAIMAAASPYILSKLTRWRDEQEEGGSGSSSSSSSASASTTSDDDTKLITITIPELGAAALNAAVHFAYTGTVKLDPKNKDATLALVVAFEFLGMRAAVEAVLTWVSMNATPEEKWSLREDVATAMLLDITSASGSIVAEFVAGELLKAMVQISYVEPFGDCLMLGITGASYHHGNELRRLVWQAAGNESIIVSNKQRFINSRLPTLSCRHNIQLTPASLSDTPTPLSFRISLHRNS